MTPDIIKSWAIVQLKPNAYKIAKRNLRRQKFESFLPYEEITKYKNGQYILTKRPLFPGYMFVAFEKGSMLWHKINCTYGISKLLTICNEPHTVPNTIIATLMAQCNSAGVLIHKNQFCRDDRVRLINGPFHNFLATVESIDEDQRIWVLIDLMGQKTRTLVNPVKLEFAT